MGGKKKNNNPFRFRQFEIHHHHCSHKVGFDGVLLGAWARFNISEKILDLGTGSGLIALMAAQQNPSALITAIDIDPSSVSQAMENFRSSTWSNRLKCLQGNFFTYPFEVPFDHVVSNPPYYLEQYKSGEHTRDEARHFSAAQMARLFAKAAELISKGGKFSIIAPWIHKDQLQSMALDNDFWTIRSCVVYTGNPARPERILLEYSNQKGDCIENELYVHDSHGQYSEEYSKLTGDFYL